MTFSWWAPELAAVESIPGWLSDVEAEFLYHTARGVDGRGAIVEIGSWKGKSAAALATGLRDAGARSLVYAIDTFEGSPEHQDSRPIDTLPEFQANIASAEVASLVRPIVSTSLAAAAQFREPIAFLFIDGDHSYEHVRADFDVWSPKVIPGGIIAMHDTTAWEGPKRVVRESIYRKMRDIHLAGSITYATNAPCTVADRLRAPWLSLMGQLHIAGKRFPLPPSVKSVLRRLIVAAQ